MSDYLSYHLGRVQRLMMGAEEESRPLNMDEIRAIRENMAAIVLHPDGLSQGWLPGLVDDVRKAMDNYNKRF